MTLPTITPKEAQRLLANGAVLVDIRGRDEYARERIPGARNRPVDTLSTVDEGAREVIFHCKSGNRTAVNAPKLASAAACDAFILEGGIEAWKQAGLPVARDTRQPIEMQRQVQIVAGSLVLLGIVLGQYVVPGFLALSAFVGAGLVFAGVSGWCGMAKVLAVMPWNRRGATGEAAQPAN
jgi:rhodanese-related sulfurtransferase